MEVGCKRDGSGKNRKNGGAGRFELLAAFVQRAEGDGAKRKVRARRFFRDEGKARRRRDLWRGCGKVVVKKRRQSAAGATPKSPQARAIATPLGKEAPPE